MRDLAGKLAVVGHQQRAAGVVVEPSDRSDSRRYCAHQIRDGAPALWIAQRGHDGARFVEHHVNQWLRHQAAAIHVDARSTRIRLGAKLGHFVTVHADPARADQLLCTSSRSDAGAR
jgi:hypothetical protein